MTTEDEAPGQLPDRVAAMSMRAVDVLSKTLFGSVRQEAGEVAPAGAPRVTLVGGTVFGDVRVRAQRLRERLAQHVLNRGSAA